MRNALLLSTCLFLLSACSEIDDYWGGDSGRDGYNHGYRGYGDGGYYPYGNANYPRDRIYIIDGRRLCRGYAYQGYCYLDKNDYRNAVTWDQNHRNDANWTKKRKDWCNYHDCGRDHDTYDRDDRHDRDDHSDRGHHYGRDDRNDTLDARGRPIEPRVERDRAEKLYPQHGGQEPRHHEGRNGYPANEDKDRSSSQSRSTHGNAARPDRDSDEQAQRYHQQRSEPAQQRTEPVQRSQQQMGNQSSGSEPKQGKSSRRKDRNGQKDANEISPE